MSAREQFVSELLGRMTLAEKIGQLEFRVGDHFNTGPTMTTTPSDSFDRAIRSGALTGLFNIHGADYLHRLQRIAVEESRLGIPLLFGGDVIHGLKTIFPIPLAESATWNLSLIAATARAAAVEATAAGMHWTFAPMCDIGRDARWGRITEGGGEDPWLGGEIAAARVQGFQGADLAAADTVAACVKHFAAYGAPEGGREYNRVDMSERQLREVYLPPYRRALEAGAATVMTAFNDLNGVPCTANRWLLQDVLRQEWGFEGVVVSDWGSVGELVAHGVAADDRDAARQALTAGTDLDMMSGAYGSQLESLLAAGEMPLATVDAAVHRILCLKYDLGLFDDPFRYGCPEAEQRLIGCPVHRELARRAARESLVLLENRNRVLPLNGGTRIALIGPLADNAEDMNGTWSFFADRDTAVSVSTGLAEAGFDLLFAEGCDLHAAGTEGFAAAVSAACEAEVAVMVLGESAVMNGEAASRADIGLPGEQLALFRAVRATGTPVVVLLACGRPLAVPELAGEADALLVIWSPGSEAGRGVADVIRGACPPVGRLPVTFPRHGGQVPAHYQLTRTGRPYDGDYGEPPTERVYRSRYRDVENSPQYPFGYGLGYTDFRYSDVQISSCTMEPGGSVEVSAWIENCGERAGVEIVQLYLEDPVASVVRPLRRLRGFRRLELAPGTGERVVFSIMPSDIALLDIDLREVVEPGAIDVVIAAHAGDPGLRARFCYSTATAQ